MDKYLLGIIVTLLFAIFVTYNALTGWPINKAVHKIVESAYVRKALTYYNQENYTKALKLFEEACDMGDIDGCNNLGVMYEKGQGVEQDYLKAVELYRKACDGGSIEGCNNLGLMYANGKGVMQDFEKAKEFFPQAFEMGSETAFVFHKHLVTHELIMVFLVILLGFASILFWVF